MIRDGVRLWVLAFVLSAAGAFRAECRATEVGQLVAVRETTQAMRGAKTPVTIAEGTRFEVLDAKNGWVLGQFELEGQKILGWLRETHLESTDQTMTSEDARVRDFDEQLAQRRC